MHVTNVPPNPRSLHFRAQTAFDERDFRSVLPSQLSHQEQESVCWGMKGKVLFLSVPWLQMNPEQESVSMRCYHTRRRGRCWHCLAWAGKEAPHNKRDSTQILGRKISVPFWNCNERLSVASPCLHWWSDCREPTSGDRIPGWSSGD